MNFTVIGLTQETEKFSEEDLLALKTLGGKNAGICYMGDKYFETNVSDPAKALPRFIDVANIGHHSIADHTVVEVLFENISKMLAIVLNSLQDYATSEKSGRYTVMTGNSEREVLLYNGWIHIFKQCILDKYPDLDDDVLNKAVIKKNENSGYIVKNGVLCKLDSKLSVEEDVAFNSWFYNEAIVNTKGLPSVKLAQENARYVLSVFTRSTSMGYSASIRQWNYIYDWCLKYMSRYEFYISDTEGKILVYKGTTDKATYFESELYSDFKTLSDWLKENLYVDELRDTKDRCFEFLTWLSGDPNHPMASYHVVEADMLMGRDETLVSEDDYLGVTYSVSYPASFVHIAQAERHRTLKYFMQFNPHCKNKEYFVPYIIRGTKYEDEWLRDLDSLSDLVPQATMVGVIETGHVSDFILKCKERLCGRAQIEIMRQTEATAKRFIEAAKDTPATSVLNCYVSKFVSEDGTCKTKCKMLGACKEPCRWAKSNDVFARSI